MSSLSVVSDLVVSLQSDPLRQWSVLLGSFSQLLLGSERFVSLDVSITVWNSKLKIHDGHVEIGTWIMKNQWRVL